METKKIKIQDLTRLHQSISSELRSVFDEHLVSSAFIMGKPVTKFESEFSNFTGADYVVGVANGTDALELALEALKIGAGHSVVVPSMTFTATAEAVARMGATPIFADLDESTFVLSVATIQDAIKRAHQPVKAVILVHLYGHMAPETVKIAQFCKDQGIKLIEDCAQSQGAFLEINGKKTHSGAAGDIGTFSFYPGKNLGALGDAGAVITKDLALAQELRMLRDHGRTDKYTHVRVGRNSRLDALQAGFLSVKLRKLAQWNQQRQKLAQRYYKELEVCQWLTPVAKPQNLENHVFHQYVVQLKPGKHQRAEVMKFLAEKGIETGIHYPIPLHQQQAFAALASGLKLPVTERIAPLIFSLPMDPLMTEDEVATVCKTLKSL